VIEDAHDHGSLCHRRDAPQSVATAPAREGIYPPHPMQQRGPVDPRRHSPLARLIIAGRFALAVHRFARPPRSPVGLCSLGNRTAQRTSAPAFVAVVRKDSDRRELVVEVGGARARVTMRQQRAAGNDADSRSGY
jgi:hypothetical protein